MPKAAPINPDLIRAIFDYDPELGVLTPKPTASNAARRTDKNQWEVSSHRYLMHRLVWAWHNPDNPNPYSVQFKDGDRTNSHIENLFPIHTNPRWIGHVKQVKGHIDGYGNVVLVGDKSIREGVQDYMAQHHPVHTPKPQPPKPEADTTFIGELEATLAPAKPANIYQGV